MARYLFIESRDPHESLNVAQSASLASQLANSGNEVTVYLVQNAVFGARANAKAPGFLPFSGEKRVRFLVDDYSLQERGIETSELRTDFSSTPISSLVDLLAQENIRAIWS